MKKKLKILQFYCEKRWKGEPSSAYIGLLTMKIAVIVSGNEAFQK